MINAQPGAICGDPTSILCIAGDMFEIPRCTQTHTLHTPWREVMIPQVSVCYLLPLSVDRLCSVAFFLVTHSDPLCFRLSLALGPAAPVTPEGYSVSVSPRPSSCQTPTHVTAFSHQSATFPNQQVSPPRCRFKSELDSLAVYADCVVSWWKWKVTKHLRVRSSWQYVIFVYLGVKDFNIGTFIVEVKGGRSQLDKSTDVKRKKK